MIHFFRHPVSSISLPVRFTDPFHYTPHPLCVEAAEEVQQYLAGMDIWKKNPEEGKMFGVLVVRTSRNEIGFLAAFSGIFDGSYLHPYFVPPIYNLQQPDGFFRQEEQNISQINQQIRQLENHPEYLKRLQELKLTRQLAEDAITTARINLKKAKAARDLQRKQAPDTYNSEALIRESQYQKAEYKRLEKSWQERLASIQNNINDTLTSIKALKGERKQRSARLQQQLFEQFRMMNARGETKNLCEIFRESAQLTPPAGAGECAAPKLLQYAYLHSLQPIAMAEFWWGGSPKTEIRRAGNYYPACQGKCGPILSYMLQGLEVDHTGPGDKAPAPLEFPEIIYEDKWLLVINKPAGMLTVPGKTTQISVYDLVRQRYPEASGPLIVHRLDMATSGLLVIAKTKATHKHLQRQFLNQTVKKRYIALLDGIVSDDEGYIRLPISPDPYDRPRQMVSEQFGKTAITYYRVLERTAHHTRIAFYPQTGRTHQLRVHAAHPLGLNCPIAGDPLYGKRNSRLFLHAEYLGFIHPISNQKLQLEKKAVF